MPISRGQWAKENARLRIPPPTEAEQNEHRAEWHARIKRMLKREGDDVPCQPNGDNALENKIVIEGEIVGTPICEETKSGLLVCLELVSHRDRINVIVKRKESIHDMAMMRFLYDYKELMNDESLNPISDYCVRVEGRIRTRADLIFSEVQTVSWVPYVWIDENGSISFRKKKDTPQ